MLGILNLQQYKIDKYIKYNTLAADLYSKIGDEYDLIKSYSKILHGYVLSNNKDAADSILSISMPLITKNPENNNIFFWSFLSYNVKYGSKEELIDLLTTTNYNNLTKDDKLDIVNGFIRLGDYDKAMDIISNIKLEGSTDDTLKYLAVKTDLYDKKGDYKEAYKNYKAFSVVSERVQWNLLSKDLLFAEERHNLEIDKLSAIGAKNRLIVYILSATLSLLIFFIILFFRYRIAKAKRIISEKDNENLRLEQENMKKEMEKIELQRDKKILEAANLNLEKSRLESERDNLKELIKNSSELTMPFQDIVRERLDKLNSLLAKEIAGKDKYADSYTKWVWDVQKNKDKFMKSTRLAFTVTLPPNLKVIPAMLFFRCSNLTNVNIPDSVTKIGHNAFYGCDSLQELKLPSGECVLEGNPFKKSPNLKKIYISSSTTAVGIDGVFGKEIVDLDADIFQRY